MAAKKSIEIPQVSEMSVETARRIIVETDFPSWMIKSKDDVFSEDNLFRAAFAVVSKFETENAAKPEDDDKFSTALAEFNAKFEWLEEYRKGLKELRAQFGGGGLSEEMETAKNRRNSTAKVIRDAAWGGKNIPTMNQDGSARQPKS